MSFQNLDLSYQYRSDNETGNIINDFYIPVLSKTMIYSRAVGYFTSGSLILAAQGLGGLINQGGKMRLIASPLLEEEDVEAITKGYKSREDVIERALLKNIKEPENVIEEERLNYLAWLISEEKLDIKLAVMNNNSRGIYHEKIGLMEDKEGNIIAFSGSSNETIGGLISNFEFVDVFCSWIFHEQIRVSTKAQNFNKLWNNATSNVTVLDFPTAVKNKLLTYKKYNYIPLDPSLELENEKNSKIKEIFEETYPRIPSGYEIRDYQKEAVENWFKNNGQGLLEMATGTGKTITALTAASMLFKTKKYKKLAIIIVCPYKHLVDQWAKEARIFNLDPLIAYESKLLWERKLSHQITAFNTNILKSFCLITTNSTFSSSSMQKILKEFSGEVLFIADEAHHLGSTNIKKILPNQFPYRLALSATPNRWFDESGTSDLLRYFGGQTVYEFGLDKAIEYKFLTEYFYFPHIVYLEEDESEQYFELTRKIGRMFPQSGDFNDASESLQGLLIERSRILGRARGKLASLENLLEPKKQSNYNIVYCGDSSLDGEKQIDSVIKLLGKKLNMKVHTFTSRENQKERQRLLQRFENKELQTLVAIKCLDEGVDIPATQTAYILASSSNPREFIQRRGRVLRRHKDKQYAYIHDFIVLPRNLKEVSTLEPAIFNIERNMIQKELIRFSEFASLAINGPQAHEKLLEVKKIYNLLEI